MTPAEEDFLRNLRSIFQVEAAEHIQTITSGLLELEGTSEPAGRTEILETITRAAHSMKGAARAVELREVEIQCHHMESTLTKCKQAGEAPTAAVLDEIHAALNAIAEATAANPPATVESTAGSPAQAETESTDGAEPAAPAGPPAPLQVSAGDTVRLSIAKLEAHLVGAEELVAVKQNAGQRVGDFQALQSQLDAWQREWSGFETGVSDRSGRFAGGRTEEFIRTTRERLNAMQENVSRLSQDVRRDHHVVGRLVDDLLEESKQLLLLPFATLAVPLSKLVRDLCRDQAKEAELQISGQELEIDKRILEEMKDPLIHLLRNAVDHGVEPPDQRVRAGKSPQAVLSLSVSALPGRRVEFVLADDGAGIDTAKVREAAVRHGVLSAGQAAQRTDSQLNDFIFMDEISSRSQVSTLSGRGLGLAIVREQAEKLGGSVAVESTPGEGTCFRVVLPSTLSTFRGITVEVGNQLFILPTAQVEGVGRVESTEIHTVEGRETITWRNRAVAWVRLADILGLAEGEIDPDDSGMKLFLLVGRGDQQIALAVQAVKDEQEVLVKPLLKPLSRVRNIAGATVLGSGRLVPILEISDLMKSARQTFRAAVSARDRESAQRPTILFVEDSFTSRTLIKGILEADGFRVLTAVDGLEGYARLRHEKIDLVISDVDMPRLDGFGLTDRIRKHHSMADLPVILVTARETPEDRERGLNAGADAYLTKSGFDQTSLLETVRRLL